MFTSVFILASMCENTYLMDVCSRAYKLVSFTADGTEEVATK